jgi:hypothetical protein
MASDRILLPAFFIEMFFSVVYEEYHSIQKIEK